MDDVIYLQPWCDSCAAVQSDVEWCEDDVWEKCEECPALSTKFLKATPEREAAGELLAALEAFTGMYVSMIDSGDCGFWNPEEEAEVIAARAAIAKARGQ